MFSMHSCLNVSSVQQNYTFTYADMWELGFYPFLILEEEDSEIWEEKKILNCSDLCETFCDDIINIREWFL
jgi:hypothetical protein